MTDAEILQLVADVSEQTKAQQGFDVTYVAHGFGKAVMEIQLMLGRDGLNPWQEGDQTLMTVAFSQGIGLSVLNTPSERPRIVELMVTSTTRGFNQWLKENGVA